MGAPHRRRRGAGRLGGRRRGGLRVQGRPAELLAGNASATGPFTAIGKFDTQNLRLFKSPYQEFRFPPVTATFLKVRSLGNHRGDAGAVRAWEFQLFGELE